MIDRQRGRPVLAKFFRREFAGTLVTDFWGAYNAVVCRRRQVCLGHLLRDLKHVEQYNHGERAIRPAVIIRKNTHGNRSQRGADCQAVLMSIYRTLKQRGHNPLQTITHALIEYVTTGKVPALPP
jgi:hypothetical protein